MIFSVTFSILDRLFPYLPQIIITIRGCVACWIYKKKFKISIFLISQHSFWLGIQYDSIVWVIMRRRGVSSERRRSNCSSLSWAGSYHSFSLAMASRLIVSNFYIHHIENISMCFRWMDKHIGLWAFKVKRRNAMVDLPRVTPDVFFSEERHWFLHSLPLSH